MDPEITIITIAPMGPPGLGEWSPGEKAGVFNSLATLNAAKLQNHTDVQITSILNGQVLIWNSTLNKWVNGTTPGITSIQQDGVSAISSPTVINAKNGLLVTNDGSGVAGIAPNYGTTANTIAAGDHQHTAVVIARAKFTATGVLSSGARTLSTFTIPLPSGIDWVLEAQAFLTARNNINNGTFNFGIRLGASGAYPEETEEHQTVGGVPRLCEVETVRPLVGGGNIDCNVRAIAVAGVDPSDIRAGRVIVRCFPRR